LDPYISPSSYHFFMLLPSGRDAGLIDGFQVINISSASASSSYEPNQNVAIVVTYAELYCLLCFEFYQRFQYHH
jgi:hypothetical protein